MSGCNGGGVCKCVLCNLNYKISEDLRAHDYKYRESLARLKKIENSDNSSEKPLWGTVFEKNIFNFQESVVFEKMRKNENSGFLPN